MIKLTAATQLALAVDSSAAKGLPCWSDMFDRSRVTEHVVRVSCGLLAMEDL